MNYANLEPLRRDKQVVSMPPSPLGPDYDYATAGVQLELAVAALRESLPNGQVNRTDAALKNARAALSVMEVYWDNNTKNVERNKC